MEGHDTRSMRTRGNNNNNQQHNMKRQTDTKNDDEVPVFIHTLIEIVENPNTQNLCHWTNTGNTFLIEDPDK